MTEQFANDVPTGALETTLSAGINSSTTTIPVVSAPKFPSGPDFRIRIDDELLLVTTGGSGSTSWTATRGIESTTAASHASGATVEHVITAASLQAIRVGQSFDIAEAADPGAPPANTVRLYAVDDSGSTVLKARFHTNTPVELAREDHS